MDGLEDDPEYADWSNELSFQAQQQQDEQESEDDTRSITEDSE